jgi:hypothetical protein
MILHFRCEFVRSTLYTAHGSPRQCTLLYMHCTSKERGLIFSFLAQKSVQEMCITVPLQDETFGRFQTSSAPRACVLAQVYTYTMHTFVHSGNTTVGYPSLKVWCGMFSIRPREKEIDENPEKVISQLHSACYPRLDQRPLKTHPLLPFSS